MNPRNGLKIRPCRRLPDATEKDTELVRLAGYLKCIARDADLNELDHRKWERTLRRRLRDQNKRAGGGGGEAGGS